MSRSSYRAPVCRPHLPTTRPHLPSTQPHLPRTHTPLTKWHGVCAAKCHGAWLMFGYKYGGRTMKPVSDRHALPPERHSLNCCLPTDMAQLCHPTRGLGSPLPRLYRDWRATDAAVPGLTPATSAWGLAPRPPPHGTDPHSQRATDNTNYKTRQTTCKSQGATDDMQRALCIRLACTRVRQVVVSALSALVAFRRQV